MPAHGRTGTIWGGSCLTLGGGAGNDDLATSGGGGGGGSSLVQGPATEVVIGANAQRATQANARAGNGEVSITCSVSATTVVVGTPALTG